MKTNVLRLVSLTALLVWAFVAISTALAPVGGLVGLFTQLTHIFPGL